MIATLPSQMRILFKLVLTLVLTISAVSSKATHLAGGTFTIECTGAPNTFDISILMYRDCGGASLPASFTLTAQPVGGGAPVSISMTRVNVDTLPNNAALNPCQQLVGSLCIERHTYEANNVTLPPAPGGYDLYYNNCCRNGAVTNITNPGSQNQTLWMRMGDPGRFPCNNSPVFLEAPPLEVCIGEEFVSNNSVVDNDGGIDLSTLKIIGTPAYGTASVNASTGEITYTPNAGFTGIDTIYYEVCDDHYPVGCDTAAFYAYVFTTPNAPPFLGDDKKSTSFNNATTIAVTSNDADPEGNLDLTSINVIQLPSNGTVTITASFDLRYTPNGGFIGSDTIVYTICDAGSPVLCDTATVVVNVDFGTLMPSAVHDYDTVETNVTISKAVLANDNAYTSSLNAATLSIFSGPTNGTASVNGNNIDYTSNVGFLGVDTVVYAICNSGAPVKCDTGIFRVVVVEPNVPPLIIDDYFVMYDVGPRDIPVMMNDIDLDGDLDVSSMGIVTNPANGTVTVNPNGTINYSPNVGFKGIDVFSYRLCDDDLNTLCDTATVIVQVQNSANRPILAFLDQGVVPASGSLTVNVIANDYDPDIDSFHFYLCDALEGATWQSGATPPFAIVPYSGTNSGTNPMPSAPAISLDSKTGILKGYPTTSGVYVLKVCVDEYRDGLLVSTYTRELEVNVVNCFTNTTAGIEPSDPNVPGIIQNCGDTTVHFRNASIGTSEYFWDFGDPTTTNDTSSILDPWWTYPDTGTYTVTLIANPSYPCADTATAEVRIYPGVVADFGHSLPTCVGSPISFFDSSYALAGTLGDWEWHFGDGNTSAQQNTSHTYQILGNYSVSLVAVSTYGCKDTVTKSVLVYNSPFINAGPNKTACAGDSVQLQATGAALSYEWKPATGLSCTTCLAPKASPAALTVYTVVATGQGGCLDSSTVVVNVTPGPTMDAGPDKYVCGTQAVQLSATSNPSAGVFFAWAPATGLSNPNVLNPMASPGVTTTYTLTVTTLSGCSKVDSTTVNVSNLSFDAGSPVTICNGQSTQLNGSVGVPNLIYSWTPANLVTNPNILNPTASPTVTTVFTLTVTDTLANCTDQDTVRVRVSNGAALVVSADTAICSGTSAQLSASGANNFTWNNDPTLSCLNCPDPIASPAATRTYYVSTTDTAGCTVSDSVEVSIIPLPSITKSADTAICPGTSVSLSASGGSSYLWSPASTLSCTACATTVATPTAPTTYVVRVSDANGCTDSADVQVSFRNLPAITISPNQEICVKDTVQLSASGGISYQWSPAAGLTATNIPNPKASPSVTIMYSVTVTDATGCSNVDSTQVKVNVLQPGNFIPDTSICIGDNIQLYANGFTSYQWSPAATLSCTNCPNPTATPVNTTTYTAIVEDATGCKDTGMVTVTVNSLPTPSITLLTDTICLNESVQLNGGGGTNYVWSPGTGLDCTNCPSPVASPSTTTTYSVLVTDANGCEADTSQRVTVLPLPTITKSPDNYVCKGDSIQLNVGGGIIYQWNPGTTLTCTTCPDPEAFPKTTTIYTVDVTDVYGCTATDSITISVNAASGNISPDTAICIGESAPLTISGGISYTWGPTNTLSCSTCPNPIATPTNTTTYSVEVTDQNACQDTGYVTVTINPLPVVGLTADTMVCQGTPVPLRATGGIQYSWSPTQGLSCTSCPVPSALPASTTRYRVRATDANGCSDTNSVQITVLPAPPVNAGNDVAICNGDTTQLNASGAANFQWNGGSLSCTNCPDPEAFPSSTTEYYLTGTHANGCERFDTVLVTVNPLPTASVQPATSLICDGDSVQLTASGGVTYQWSPSYNLTCTNCPDPIAFPLIDTSYTVRVTNQFGCWDETTVQVNVTSPASADVTPDTGVCPGGSVVLSADGGPGATYNWAPNLDITNPSSATPTVTPTQPREYTVTITDVNNCVVTVPVDIDIYTPADPLAGTDATICFGDSAQLTAQNGTTYTWAPSASIDSANSASPTASPSSTTVYTVSIVDANGCTNTDEVTITVVQPPVVDAGPDQSIYEGELAFIGATGAQTYVWTPTTYFVDSSSTRLLVGPPSTTTFYVVGTDANGCTDMDSVTIKVLPEADFYIPTGFSPNGDGKNDLFRVFHAVNFNMTSLRVYNRWGNLLFEGTNVNDAWDGTGLSGEPMPIGTYIYVLEAYDDIGKVITRKGNITLIR